MKVRIVLAFLAVLAGCLAAAAPSNAAGYSVKTCQSLSGPGAGPVPVNVSKGRFSAETSCRLGGGGQTGFRLQPVNQGSGQRSSRTEWAALQWGIPPGVSLARAWAEVGGTSANGSGSGFSGSSSPWMFRTFGLGFGGLDLFAARFSVANNSFWFNSSDSPGLYGWFWGNESGGLGTPAQWTSGQPFSFNKANGLISSSLPEWANFQIGDTGISPALTGRVPTGPYVAYRAELRCSQPDCRSEGFSHVQLQNIHFAMDDPEPPTAVTARPEAGPAGSNGARLIAGDWLSGGRVPISWSASDAGTGISGARPVITPGPTGTLTEVNCAGGGPGQVRISFKPCAVSGSSTINLDLTAATQGHSTITICAEDGVAQRACSPGINLRRDSIAPVIDAPSMKLTRGAAPGFTLGLANPDEAAIVGGSASTQMALTFTVERWFEGEFETVVPTRTADVSLQGTDPVIAVTGVGLDGDGLYRVCARLADAAGNSPAALSCTNLTVDDALPDTTIVSGPRTLTGDPVARFGYTSNRPMETGFECRADGGDWSPCPGPSVENPFPVTLAGDGSADGEHLFEVRAWLQPGTSGTGRRVDPTPAAWRWTLDSSPPDTMIVTGPPPVAPENVTFTFRSTEPGTFECRIDGSDWAPCTSPRSYVDLEAGDHLFRVRAIDRVGLADPTPAEREFRVVPTPPVVEIVEKPVLVPSHRYCALTGFSIRPVHQGISATITASRYSRFVRIQLFRDTPAVRRALLRGDYRELRMYTPTGPILNLKRKAIRNQRRSYVFPKVNLRTFPAIYDFLGRSLIAVPRVSNEWNKCVVRYRKHLGREMTGIQTWKKSWGIDNRFSLHRD